MRKKSKKALILAYISWNGQPWFGYVLISFFLQLFTGGPGQNVSLNKGTLV